MSDTSIDDLFNDDDKATAGAKPKPARKPRAAKPKADETPAAKDEPVDTAVRIRRLDWECECGNTNTHDLQRCGKCSTHRYR